jgi:hypothetical protein
MTSVDEGQDEDQSDPRAMHQTTFINEIEAVANIMQYISLYNRER